MAENNSATENKKSRSGLFSYMNSFVDFRKWMSLDNVKKNASDVKSLVEGTFEQEGSETHKDNFEDIVKKIGLTAEDIEKKKMDYLTIAVFVLALAIGMLAYAFYMLLVVESILAFGASLGIVSALLSVAFRFHFWYYQFARRKLGCTVKEWKRDLFRRG